VDKKIPTISFGAQIPPELAEAFSRRVASNGWMKKRALAAAVRAFLAADDATCAQWYADTYKSISQPKNDTTNPKPKARNSKSETQNNP